MLQIQGQTRWIGHSVTLRSTPEDPNPTLVDQEVPSSILGASTIVFSKLRDIPKTLSASCQHYVSTLTGFGAGTEAPAPPSFRACREQGRSSSLPAATRYDSLPALLYPPAVVYDETESPVYALVASPPDTFVPLLWYGQARSKTPVADRHAPMQQLSHLRFRGGR